MSRYFFLPALLLFLGSNYLIAQQDSSKMGNYKITLTDGTEVIGKIQSENESEIQFKTISDIKMTIPKQRIKSIEQFTGEIVLGVVQRKDPNRTRLFFAPTARALKSGQGYFSDYEIFFPMMAFGVANVATIAGGMSLIPGARNQAFYFAPKVTPVHLEKLDAAAGVLYISAPGFDESLNFGIAYGVGTYGTENTALTLGLGWGFAEGDFANKPIVLLGGEIRMSNSVKFITENWIPPSSDVIVASFGFRFFGDQLAADLGLVTPLGAKTEGFPFMPWVAFVYNFGISN